MIVVLDASAAVRIALSPGGNPELARAVADANRVLSPELAVAEVANAFWKYVHAGLMSHERAEQGAATALSLIDDLVPLMPLRIEALALGMSQDTPVYDMFYVVLARRYGATLVTVDRRLSLVATRAGVRFAGFRPTC